MQTYLQRAGVPENDLPVVQAARYDFRAFGIESKAENIERRFQHELGMDWVNEVPYENCRGMHPTCNTIQQQQIIHASRFNVTMYSHRFINAQGTALLHLRCKSTHTCELDAGAKPKTKLWQIVWTIHPDTFDVLLSSVHQCILIAIAYGCCDTTLKQHVEQSLRYTTYTLEGNVRTHQYWNHRNHLAFSSL